MRGDGEAEKFKLTKILIARINRATQEKMARLISRAVAWVDDARSAVVSALGTSHLGLVGIHQKRFLSRVNGVLIDERFFNIR